MRILSIGNFGTGWDGSICDEEHIAKALEDLGHKVTRQQRYSNAIIDYPTDALELYDFILVAQWDGYSVHLITNIREKFKCPIVYWAFDYQADGQEWHEKLIEQSDLYLSKRIADSKYLNWQYLSQDFAPQFLKPYYESWLSNTLVEDNSCKDIPDIDVLFTGSYLEWATERNETLKAVNEKFNLVIHSVNSWPEEWGLDVRPPIMDKELPKLYVRAKVILSIDHTIESGYWSDRNAQIIACGRKPLFRYIPLSETRFGDMVTYFYNIEDCLNKIEWLLNPQTFQGKTFNLKDWEYYFDGFYVQDKVRDLLTIVGSIL